MARVNYRIVVLVAALSCAVLSAIALAFMVTALVEYRADDFFTATTTKDFTTLGTCVETLTKDQLDELDYLNPELECKEDTDLGNRFKLINTLRTNVHSAYYAYHSATTGVASKAAHDPGDYLETVISAMAAHVLGKVVTFYPTPETFVNVGLNFSSVYQALELVARTDIPVSCDDIYGLTYTDIGDTNDLEDTEYELYIKNIRKGRLNSDGKTKSTWPLAEFATNCPDDDPSDGVDYLPVGQATPEAVLTADHLKYMYAHCTAQFQYASVGTVAWEGTYAIPLPGIEPGPYWYPYAQVDGFNETSSYNMRTRLYLGQRFGLSIWAYVPMFLATCFLLGDSLVFFFSEALMPITLSEQFSFSSNGLDNIRDSLVIMATTKASRKKRLALGFAAVLGSLVFYAIFIAAPWGFFYTNLPRPICEKGADGLGAAPDHGVPQIGWKGTKGGWKSDYDATWYDLAALSVQLLVLFTLPLTTTDLCRNLNKAANEASNGRTTESGVFAAAKYVHTHAAYRFMQKVLVIPMVVGIVIALVGQSISGARFGMAWAEGVVAQETDKEGVLIFDEVALSEHVYDQTIATLSIVVVCGLVFSVAIQRHLINGVGCFSAGLFFGWIALVVVFALPLLIYAGSRSIFQENAANEDCASFPRNSHEMANDLCIARFWTLLVGGGLFVGAVLIITVLGLLEAVPALFANRNKTAVTNQGLNQELNPIMRATGPGTMAAGFRSKSELFFNISTKKKSPTAQEFLYGDKLKAPPARS